MVTKIQKGRSNLGGVAQLGEHCTCTAAVVGSNPITSTTLRDVVQLGRTLALGARGRWFKSSHLDILLHIVTIFLWQAIHISSYIIV
tara:strand:- start:81 stop:341 length:261 start_codon:yes stop_codon:yes gene_type:complete